MKRLILVLTAVAFAIVGLTGPAIAASPHVVKGPTTSISGNSLVITASIAGLGNVPTANFSLTGTVDVSSRCYTKSGNKPQAANKQETISVNQMATFPVRNGRTDVSFTVTPLSTLTCPGGQHVVIESVSYDLQIVGEGLTVDVP
jgi:hypothetical protein